MPREYNKKGNPFKRGSTWTFIYYETDLDGNKRQRWKGGYKTKKEAEEDLKKYQANAILNRVATPCSMTVEQLINENWFPVHHKNLEANTINGYLNNINRHIIPAIGNIKLKDLKPAIIESFYFNTLTDVKKLSPRSVKYVHGVLKTALNYAVKNKITEYNVCNDVELPKIKKYKSKLLTQEQTRILIKHISGKRYETEITLALALGLRRGEILGIRISDIDFDNHVLTICNQVTTNKVKDTSTADEVYYGLKCVKTECSNRELCISEPIEKLLKRKIMYNDMQKHIFKEDYHDYDLICCKDNGEPMSPQTVYHAFKRILKECNLPDIRFHDLRHIYATICIDKNIPVKVLSQALGHSSTAVTDRVYADSIQKKRELPDIICSAINLND